MDFSSGVCADGRVCPEGWTCDVDNRLCIPPGCGDEAIRGAEKCDGDLVPGDCTSHEFYEPDGLACRTDCTFDTSSCVGRCGDRTINGPEVCDGIPPAGQSCTDYGYDTGRLDCSAACGPAVAACGVIGWHTTLGGASNVLRSVWGAGANDMFAVGFAGTILHSTGGAWLAMPSVTTVDLHSVWGSDGSNVFAVGAGGTILHYNGTQWSAMPSNTTATLNGVWGTGPNDVFAVGTGGTIAHFDGATWTARIETTADLLGISGSSGLVLAVGKEGTILRFQSSTWTRMNGPNGTTMIEVLNAVWTDGNAAFAVGSSAPTGSQMGIIWRFDGSSWSVLSQTLTARIAYSVWGTAPNDVFLGMGFGVLLHYDGTTFEAHDAGSARSLFGIWGTGPDHVFAVTQGGTVQEYTGTRWDVEAVGTAELKRIWRFDNGHAVATGLLGTIAEFDGSTWTTSTITNTTWLRSIWAQDENTVFIAAEGANSGIYRGSYPAFVRITNSITPLALWGSSNGDLWAAGNGLLIWRSSLTNPSSWTPVYGSGTSGVPDLRAFWGTSPTDIFVVGDGGTILHYDGSTWTPMSTPTTVQLDDIWGTAPDNVFAIGQQGVILHFNGSHWRRMTSNVGENLAGIAGTGPHDIFIAGVNGMILHYDGVSWSPVAPSVFGDFRAVAASPTASLFVGVAGALHRLERVCRPRETFCGDAWDDDCDGLINCADPDCVDAGECARGGACPRVGDVECGADVKGSTSTGIARIDELRCGLRSTPGPEAAYRFTAPVAGGSVTVDISELGADLDLAITGAYAATGSCELARCIGATSVSGTSKQLTFDAAAGETYYFIVDGPADIAEDFRLTVTCP